MKRIIICILVFALSLSCTLLLSGCGNGGSGGSSTGNSPQPQPQTESKSTSDKGQQAPASAEPTTILTSGHLSLNVGLPLYLGEVKGLYQAEGLVTPRVHYLSGPPQLEALPSGAWEIGWIGITAANTGVLRYGVKIIGVGGIDGSHKMFVREDSDIYQAGNGHLADYPEVYGTADTWRGKNILCEKGTLHYLNLILALEKFGLVEDDVNIIHMDAMSALQAFKAGEGDVLVTLSNTTMEAQRAGFKQVETIAQINAAMPGVIIASPEYLSENSEAVEKYLRASVLAQQYIRDESNLNECAELYQKFVAEEGGTELSLEEALNTIHMFNWMNIDEMKELYTVDSSGLSGLQKLYGGIFDYYVSLGLCQESDKEIIINAIDTSYLENAIKGM